MQSCLIDGQVRDLRQSSADSLGSMMNSLSEDIVKNGRFICSLRVNGREVADLDKESNRRLDGIHSVEIATESPLDLARKIIAEGKGFIGGLQDCLTQTARFYTSGSEHADRYFNESVQGLEWFVQMVDFIERTLKLDFGRLSLNGEPVGQQVHRLNVIFRDIVDTQEKSDQVLLADILEYDLVPHLEEWKDIFTLFQDQSAAYAC